MRPVRASLDLRDRDPTHAVESADLSLRRSLRKQSSDLTHVSLGQLGAPVSLSASQSSVSPHVSHVLGAGSPAQILNPIVRWVTVKMSAFASGRTRADESRENKPVNEHVSAASSGAEMDLKMPAAVVDLQSEKAPNDRALCCSDTLDASVIRDFVGSLEPSDRLPDFDVDSGSNSGDSHDQSVSKGARNLWQGIARSFLCVRDVVRVVKIVLAAV